MRKVDRRVSSSGEDVGVKFGRAPATIISEGFGRHEGDGEKIFTMFPTEGRRAEGPRGDGGVSKALETGTAAIRCVEGICHQINGLTRTIAALW